MAHLVEFPVGDGTAAVVTFEVDAEEPSDDLVLASRDGAGVAVRARTSLEKMGGATRVIVAKGTAEANFQPTSPSPSSSPRLSPP